MKIIDELRGDKKVLVVDDDRDTWLIICKLLERYGYKTQNASNGRDALNILLNDNVDLLLTNWNMPIMDGVELIKRVRETNKIKDIPLILFSARSDRIKGVLSGANDYFIKPFESQELLYRVHMALLNHKKIIKRIEIKPGDIQAAINSFNNISAKLQNINDDSVVNIIIEQDDKVLRTYAERKDGSKEIIEDQ